MSGRPVRRRVLAEVQQAGGWPVVLARIAFGELVAEIARSFGVSRSFFARLLHDDRERHALVVEARWRADADGMLVEAVEMIGGFYRPDAARLRSVLGEGAAALDRVTLATLDRLRTVLQSGAEEGAAGAIRRLPGLADHDLDAADLGRLFIESVSAASRRGVRWTGWWHHPPQRTLNDERTVARCEAEGRDGPMGVGSPEGHENQKYVGNGKPLQEGRCGTGRKTPAGRAVDP